MAIWGGQEISSYLLQGRGRCDTLRHIQYPEMCCVQTRVPTYPTLPYVCMYVPVSIAKFVASEETQKTGWARRKGWRDDYLLFL